MTDFKAIYVKFW